MLQLRLMETYNGLDEQLWTKKIYLPSFFEIQQVITQCPELQRRTPAQVKTYISNQHRKLSRKRNIF
nr:unnamed protein product [Callosobruchus analis]